MPKLKTKKSIQKRMKITKTGKVLRRKPGSRHYKAHKSGSRKRSLRGTDLCVGKIAKTMKILLAPGQ
jgi:large subunit ribosomal protein L35